MPSVSRENARIFFLLAIFFLTLVSRNDAPGLITAPFFGASRLGRLRDAHGILNSTKYGDFRPLAAAHGAPPWQTPHYLNLTGFREADRYAWDDLAYFKDRCRQWSRHAYPPLKGADEWEHGPVGKTWQNATGTVHGKWVRRPGSVVKQAGSYNLSAIAPGVDWGSGHYDWGWNVTGSHGTILLRLSEDADDAVYQEEVDEGKLPRPGGVAREISAMANIQDEAHSASSFAIRLHGVHWPKQGSILLTTTTEKFSGIFGLPHLVPSSEFYLTGQRLLNRTLGEVLSKRERNRFGDPSNPWTPVVEEEISVPMPRCEYVMYLQLHPLDPHYIGEKGVDDRLVPVVDQLEKELRFPTGAPSKGKPDLRMSMVAWSPDCAYYLESKGPPLFPSVEGHHLIGVKSEVLLSRTKDWMFAFAAVLMAQLWLLKTQMKESNTPSTLGRISFETAAMMLLADGLVFACSSAWSLSATNTFLPSLILTFAAFMSMSIGADIDAEIAENTASGAAALPLPNTTTLPGSPAGRPRVSAFASIAGTFVLLGIAILILTAMSLSWPPRARSAYFNLVAFSYLSLWTPQIRRNVWRNSRRAFAWRFMVGQSALRLLPFAYFYLRTDNVLFVGTDGVAFLVLAGWVWAQLVVLAVQDVLGPRFGLPARWMPEVWEYHPVLREDDAEGGGLPIGLVSSGGGQGESAASAGGMEDSPVTGRGRRRSWSFGAGAGAGADGGAEDGGKRREREKELGRHGMALRSIDCAICTETLEVPVVRANAKDPSAAGGLVGVFARRAYMVTPCRHIFHTKCLEGWFKYKLQCPICREELPPL
ncbi:hypothetical protein NEMBOFW57_005213 [Staphylotrichum longicolle]|uniref:DSC E3 ubiquitin ligase complex subunit A n=1 Tax=Staphylotrichum longicolle TaxID=669026 RepID=A0AAD4EWI3_9PEZI|nr:hypothetical protein NEMBOFW57_005213 [Staphylotrichum longicolle]